MILGCQHCQHALFFRVLPGMIQTDLDIVQLAVHVSKRNVVLTLGQVFLEDFSLPLCTFKVQVKPQPNIELLPLLDVEADGCKREQAINSGIISLTSGQRAEWGHFVPHQN